MGNFYEERIFPPLCDVVMRQMEPLRPKTVAEARGRVLEIGLGTARNLPYMQGVTELVGLEPSPGMTDIAKARIRHAPFPVEVVHAGAESMPFPDASFDTVLATFVFCTIPDPHAAAREVRRILRPGGKLVMLEHVRDRDPAVARWQERITPVWKVLACGCVLDRDTPAILEGEGFGTESIVHLDAGMPLLRHIVAGALPVR
ncbi:MAG: class I SAM-dependent methyltransferase [Polyangiales bacterium]